MRFGGQMIDWAAWAPTGIVVAAALLNHGQLVGRINGQEKELSEQHQRLNGHDVEIKDLGNRMTASEAWREGYNAGRSK